jgi:polar amino acid transport system substrate-binding protein
MIFGMRKTAVVLFLASLFTGGSLAAQESPTIGFDEANAPFMYGQNGEAKGLYPALITAAFAKIGVAVKETPAPWTRVLATTDAGKAGVGGLYKNAEREAKYDFSAPIFQERLQIYVNTGKKFDVASVDDLTGKTVGVIRGWSYGDAFDKARAAGKFKVEEVDSDQLNLNKLGLGRIDAAVAIQQSADAVIAKNGLTGKVAAVEKPLAANDTYLAFAKTAGQAALIKRFDETIAAMRADGSYDQLVKQSLTN